MGSHYQGEMERVAKARAISEGAVLLTPKAAAYLYDMPLATVAQARRRHDAAAVAFTVDFGANKPVPLLRHQWTEEYWRRGLADRFQEMSEFGLTMGIHGRIYVILHPQPIYTDPWRTQYDPGLYEDLDQTETHY